MDSLIEVFDSGEAHGLSKTGAGEQCPLCVEPIAVSYPLEMGNDHEYEESIPQQNEPSDWVQEKYQEFGDYLGASYEGYESEVMGLLHAIEQSGLKKRAGTLVTPKGTSKQSRGVRELKNLASSINYEGGSSKRCTRNSGGALLLTCQ